MQIHQFVDGKKPIMVLIHGILTPWQIWMPQITAFKERYNVYAVALNAHTEEGASEFVKGDPHCYKATYEPEKWIEAVDAFLK